MKKSFLQLHAAVFLAGFTGVLGKLITLNEGLLVWYRLLVTVVSLWALVLLERLYKRGRRPGGAGEEDDGSGKKGSGSERQAGADGLSSKEGPGVRNQGPGLVGRARSVSRGDFWRIIGIGGVAALHWVCFFGSIKYSNVSVGLVCFSSIGFFTALMEPVIFRRRHDPVELLLGLLVIAGIAAIFRFDPHYKTGILTGILSSFLGSLFPILNKGMLQRVDAPTLTLYELTGGLLCLSVLLPAYLYFFPVPASGRWLPTAQDWGWLLILAWLCTVIAFRLSMNALRKISAFTVNLSYNLEPVYGILLAFVIYREDRYLNTGFYIGLSCVILAVGLQMARLWYRRKAGKYPG